MDRKLFSTTLRELADAAERGDWTENEIATLAGLNKTASNYQLDQAGIKAGRVMSRQSFDALPHVERAEFIRAGGKIFDTTTEAK